MDAIVDFPCRTASNTTTTTKVGDGGTLCVWMRNMRVLFYLVVSLSTRLPQEPSVDSFFACSAAMFKKKPAQFDSDDDDGLGSFSEGGPPSSE